MKLSRIQIFPIKSLDSISVQESVVTRGGILQHDRVYAILDLDGKVVNGKRTARVHRLRCDFDAEIQEVRFWRDGDSPVQFPLSDPGPIGWWLSDFFEFKVALHTDHEKGFPDDREAFGPTITSEASLRAIQGWYPQLPLESVRRRFRANLELADAEPFGEDKLFGAAGERRPFRIGPVRLLGHNPCQRCVVPTRDPVSGEAVIDFQKRFMQLRKEQFPAWADVSRFNHFYRFAVNTSIPPAEVGKCMRVGDPVTVG